MMMADCRKGLIDKILVRSISTLARDVWSCMKVLRELSALGVTIRFMDENIDTETDSQWMEFLNFYSALSAIGHEEIGEMCIRDSWGGSQSWPPKLYPDA